jgi:hypothetical protein
VLGSGKGIDIDLGPLGLGVLLLEIRLDLIHVLEVPQVITEPRELLILTVGLGGRGYLELDHSVLLQYDTVGVDQFAELVDLVLGKRLEIRVIEMYRVLDATVIVIGLKESQGKENRGGL